MLIGGLYKHFSPPRNFDLEKDRAWARMGLHDLLDLPDQVLLQSRAGNGQPNAAGQHLPSLLHRGDQRDPERRRILAEADAARTKHDRVIQKMFAVLFEVARETDGFG